VVDFKDGAQIMPSNWLNEERSAAYWPPWATDTIDQTTYNKFARKRPPPEKNWLLEKNVRYRAKGGK